MSLMPRIALAAALLAPITAGVGFEPVSAAPQGPLLVTGVVGGPGFSPAARTWVFATINDEQEHHDSAPLQRPALGPSTYTTGSGAFALAIPPSAALDAYAAKHLGWANVFVYAVSSNGAAAWAGVPVKQTPQGFVVTHIEKTFANTVSIKLPGVPNGQASKVVVGRAPYPPPPCGEVTDGNCLNYPLPPPLCYSTNYQINPPVQVDTVVAEMHTWDPDPFAYLQMQATITYYNQATSEVDLGYSADGGHWSASGQVAFNTDKKTSTSQEAHGNPGWGYEFAPVVTYFKYQDVVECNDVDGHQRYDAGYQVAPNSCCSGSTVGANLGALDGFAQYDKHCYFPTDQQHPPYCFGWSANQETTKEASTTDRYTFAANVLGFNVGVTSDWGNGLAIDYTFSDFEIGAGCWQANNCDYATKRYWLWGGRQETSFADAATLYAYAFSGPQPTLGAAPPDHVCYGGVCPI